MRALRNALVGLGIALAFPLAGTTPAGAAPAPGTLDPTFGDGGIASLLYTDASGFNDARLLVQEDDKLVVVARGIYPKAADLTFVRLLPDGTRDPQFGTGGVTIVTLPDSVSMPASALTTDGKIVAVVRKSNNPRDFLLVRLTKDGDLDASFGTSGVVTLPNPGNQMVEPMAWAGPDRSILAVVAGAESGRALVRVTEDGELDKSFGDDGVVDPIIPGLGDLAVLPDGGIIAAATTGSMPPDITPCLVRYDRNGALDTRFGDGGVVEVPPELGFTGRVFALPDGRILLVAAAIMPPEPFVTVSRFDADGRLDRSFGDDGVLKLGNVLYAPAATLQRDGKVVLSLKLQEDGKEQLVVLRLNADGSPDGGFGQAGFARGFGISSSAASYPHLLGIQSNGRIVRGDVFTETVDGENVQGLRLAGLAGSWPDADGDGVPDHRDGCPTVPAPTLNPVAQPAGAPPQSGTPQQGGGVQPAPPKPPAARIVGAVPTRLRQLARGSLPVTVACDQRCRISAKLQINRSTARRLGIAAKANTLTIGSASRALPRPGSAKLTVKLTRTAKQRLRRATRAGRRLRLPARLVVTVTWPDGGKRTLARTVTFR